MYKTEEEALKDIKNIFIKYELDGSYINNNLSIYKYEKPKYGINCLQFYKHCEHGEHIII